jgi:thymidylate kinase
MIVELFGPPGAGKSTFSRALAESLRQCGDGVELDSSARPNEAQDIATASFFERAAWLFGGNPLLRLIRAAMQFGAAILADESARCPVAARLSETFPQRSAFENFRLTQYMKRLSRRWRRAADGNEVTIFDQAYAQALVSYASASQTGDRKALASAFKETPKADLLIYIEAPYATLVQRLVRRADGQGWLERRFELDLKRNIQAIDVGSNLYGVVEEQGLHVMRGRSDDEAFLEECSREIKRLSERVRGRNRRTHLGEDV